jgi:hypothetical protein
LAYAAGAENTSTAADTSATDMIIRLFPSALPF